MSDLLPYNEKELLARIANDDPNAYRVLFDRYWDRMYANALHFIKSPDWAMDLAQEIFTRIWVKREKLREVINFESYLYVVARNMIYDELRKLQTSEQYLELVKKARDESEKETPPVIELKELQSRIDEAIGELPAQMQQAFRLSRFEGLTHAQIAQRMNISRFTSQNYVARAIIMIKKSLTDYDIHFAVLFVWGIFMS